jgi:hypothetical protein
MTDPLAEIKARWESKHPPLSPQIDWLIGEVEDLRTQLVGALDGWRTESRTATERGREIERLREERSALWWARDTQRRISENARLRGLLGRLEWVTGQWDWEACPVCRVVKAETEIHEPGCWLWAELANQPTSPDPPEVIDQPGT